jgi:phosphoenolpyruvate carboxylase
MLPGWFGFGTAAAMVAWKQLRPSIRIGLLPHHAGQYGNGAGQIQPSIARRYSELVEDRDFAQSVMARIEAEWQLAHDALLQITEQPELLARNPRLADSIQSRLPYVNALNHLQVDLLRRRREGDGGNEIHAGIHMSINGVAAGLRNSG